MTQEAKDPFYEDLERRLVKFPHDLAGLVKDPRVDLIARRIADDPYNVGNITPMAKLGEIAEEYGIPEAYAQEILRLVTKPSMPPDMPDINNVLGHPGELNGQR